MSPEEDAAQHLGAGLKKPSACPGRIPHPGPKHLLLSPRPPHCCVWGVKHPARHMGWHRPARTWGPSGVGTCPDTEDSCRGPGAGAGEPRQGAAAHPASPLDLVGPKQGTHFTETGPWIGTCLRPGSPSALLTVGLGRSQGASWALWGGGWAVSLPPLHARSTPTCDGHRCPQTLPSVP